MICDVCPKRLGARVTATATATAAAAMGLVLAQARDDIAATAPVRGSALL